MSWKKSFLAITGIKSESNKGEGLGKDQGDTGGKDDLEEDDEDDELVENDDDEDDELSEDEDEDELEEDDDDDEDESDQDDYSSTIKSNPQKANSSNRPELSRDAKSSRVKRMVSKKPFHWNILTWMPHDLELFRFVFGVP